MSTQTADDIELTIDPEFAELLPAHSDQESKSLREKVERQGKFDGTILYWPNGGKNIVLDGHQRHGLWASLPENTPIPPPIVEAVNVPDREHAKQWMLLHQAGRRNMDPAQLSVIRGRLFKLEVENPETAKNTEEKSFSQNAKNSRRGRKGEGRPQTNRRQAAKSVAEKTGVSADTVERDAEFVDALDSIGKVNSKAKHDIESGSLKVPKKTVVAISGLPEEQIGKALGNVRNGRAWNDGLSDHESNGHAEAPAPKPQDKEGHELPEKLAKVFADCKEAESKLRQVNNLIGEILAMPISSMPESAIKVALKDLKEAVKAGLAHAVCPYCTGRGCKQCETRGYVTKNQWSGIPEERRK